MKEGVEKKSFNLIKGMNGYEEADDSTCYRRRRKHPVEEDGGRARAASAGVALFGGG